MRYNFISDDGADKFFDTILGSSKIDKVFIKNNFLSDPYVSTLEKRIKDSDHQIYIDCLDKMKFLDQNRLDRSIWISPITASFTPLNIKNFFQDTHECGLVRDVRIYQGAEVSGKPSSNMYAFIEFEHENSVARSLRIASKKNSNLFGQKFRIYKAGTALNTSTKPSAAKVPAQRHRGRGGRGGRGRGCARGRGRGGRRR